MKQIFYIIQPKELIYVNVNAHVLYHLSIHLSIIRSAIYAHTKIHSIRAENLEKEKNRG